MRKLKTDELKRLSIDDYKKADKNPIVLVLDSIRSLNNIGSIFRTADAFRITKIYLCGITACPPHRDIHKTALGATESVDWEYVKNVTDLMENLKKESFRIIALEQTDNGIRLDKFLPAIDEKYAIFLGNEVNGVSEKVTDAADFCVEIPQFGTKHSFNVTVSAGIILWDILFKMRLL